MNIDLHKIPTKIREYCEEFPVEVERSYNGRIVLSAYNEGGHNGVELDLEDIIDFISEYLKERMKNQWNN